MVSRGRSAPRPARWARRFLVGVLTLVGLVGLGWLVVWLRQSPPPPSPVTQSPGPPAARAVHRVEPEPSEPSEPSEPPADDPPAAPPSLASATTTAAAATAHLGEVGSPLTRVQGIGRRSAEALSAAGIADLRALAAASTEQVGAALSAAGLRRSPTYATWPGQARELLGSTPG